MKNSVRQFDATTLMNAKVPAVSPSFAFELLVQMSCSLSTIMNIALTLQNARKCLGDQGFVNHTIRTAALSSYNFFSYS